MKFPQELTVKVTQYFIDKGVPFDINRCPIAYAVAEAVEAPAAHRFESHVNVGADTALVFGYDDLKEYRVVTYYLPIAAQQYIYDFDRRMHKMESAEFTLTLGKERR